MLRTIDLRSDTVTRPTAAMRAAMAEAEVGDDLAGEDPTVNRLQSLAAALLGTEQALYVPTGTMANQLALRALGRPGTEVVCAERAHIYCYEDAGAARNAGLQLRPLSSWDALSDALAGSQHHLPKVSVVAIENTMMAAGGVPMDADEVASIAHIADGFQVPVHCDGARLWNAAVALNRSPKELAAPCTTIMFCLSKGLGAPIGSLLCGPRDVLEIARADKHRMGGGWRQAGIVAAAGIVALETMVERLAEDHEHARAFANEISARWPGALDPQTVRTNIVCADSRVLPRDILPALAEHGVLADTIDARTTRFVFHYEVTDDDVAAAVTALDRVAN